MAKKLVFWLLGGSCSGKTTQHRLLLKNLSDVTDGVLIQGQMKNLTFMYTKFGNVATLGKIGQNQCTGIDSVYSKLGADGVALSLKMALEDKDIDFIIVECLFSTMKWLTRWDKLDLRLKMNLLVVHLSFSEWDNYKRLCQRRAKKEGKKEWWEIDITNNTILRVGSKNRENEVIYRKLEGLVEDRIQVQATLSEIKIQEQILNFIQKNL